MDAFSSLHCFSGWAFTFLQVFVVDLLSIRTLPAISIDQKCVGKAVARYTGIGCGIFDETRFALASLGGEDGVGRAEGASSIDQVGVGRTYYADSVDSTASFEAITLSG